MSRTGIQPTDHLTSASGAESEPQPGSLDRWLNGHLWVVVLALTVAGLAVRLRMAIPSFLNPDEILHLARSAGPRLLDTYQRTIAVDNTHPPLYFFLLHFWRMFGSSDFWFRLPSVLASTATLWVGFKWMRDALGRTAALGGLVVLAFAPEVVRVSIQVREYGLLLLLVVSALYFLERGFQEASATKMGIFVLMLLLSVSVHYTTIWLAVAIGIYAVVRWTRERLPGAVTWTWAAGQACFAGLTLLYYFTHISRLASSRLGGARLGHLSPFYPQDELATRLLFPFESSFGVFRYLFSPGVVGLLVLVLFLAAIVLLMTGWRRAMSVRSSRRELVLLLTLPFVIGCVAALCGLYPYGGTRHVLHLAVFAAAGIGFFCAQFLGRRLWPVLAAAAVLVPLWNSLYRAPVPFFRPENERRELIVGAMEYVRQITPQGGVVQFDFETGLFVSRYFCRGKTPDVKLSPGGQFASVTCDGYRLIRTDTSLVFWSQNAWGLGDVIGRMAHSYGLRRGEPVTVLNAGWGWNLADEVSWKYKVAYPKVEHFGGNISAFVVPAGLEPNSPQAGLALARMVHEVALGRGRRAKSVFWPTDHSRDTNHVPASELSEELITYERLRTMMDSAGRSLDGYLPALAFWVFDNYEEHSEVMRQMDRREDFRLGRFEFHLLGADPDSFAGLYSVESRAADVLDSLARVVAAEAGTGFQAVFWPTDYPAGPLGLLRNSLQAPSLSYAELYRSLRDGGSELVDYLPALAFWVFGTREEHQEPIAHMAEAESYVSGQYRVTLMLVDTDTTVGVYAVQAIP